jgi:hypothetical protein
MARPPRRAPPVFLERASYRARRRADAAAILPVIAGALWMMPLLWRPSTDGGLRSSTVLIVIFGIWILAILAALLLGRRLARDTDSSGGPGEDPGQGPG